MTVFSTIPTQDDLGARITRFGIFCISASLVVIYVWFRAMRLTTYEAAGLEGLVSTSFVIAWMYNVFSLQGFSTVLGLLELLSGFFGPESLEFPAIIVMSGHFLFKDIGLLAASIFAVGYFLLAVTGRRRG